MTLDDVMARLEELGHERVRVVNARHGAGDNQFGVKNADLRALAKTLKNNHDLGLALWATGNVDARQLATLILSPKKLTPDELEAMVAEVTYPSLADWVNTNLLKPHPEKETLRQKWMTSDHPMLARAAWSLTTERVLKQPEGLDLNALLNRVESEMATAPEPTQWTMNYCLASIGIEFAEHRERAIAIGEKLGVFRDYPTPKGCTSPFVPLWVAAMVSRKSV